MGKVNDGEQAQQEKEDNPLPAVAQPLPASAESCHTAVFLSFE